MKIMIEEATLILNRFIILLDYPNFKQKNPTNEIPTNFANYNNKKGGKGERGK